MTARILPALALTALTLGGCAGSGTQGEDPLQANNPGLEVRWVEAGTRPPPFERVMLAPLEMQFRDVAPLTGPPGTPTSRTEYPVPERDRERIRAAFEEIFREELGDSSQFKLTDQPAAGVLLVKPALRDIVSRVPPEEPPGRSDVFLDEVGEATLVVDFVDAASGRTLGSASDRSTAQPAGSMGNFGAVRADRVGAGTEVRRLARRWATSLEKRLEQLYFEAKPR